MLVIGKRINGRKNNVQLLLLAIAVWGTVYARFALGPLQEAVKSNLSLTNNQIALLQGAALAVPMAALSVPFGLLVDRWPRAPIFIAVALLSLVTTAIMGAAHSFSWLFILRCFTGVAYAGATVAAYSMVGDLYSAAQRGRATMIVALGEIGGAPAAFAIGGVLLTAVGNGAAGWHQAVMEMSLVLVPVVPLMLAIREPQRTGIVVRNPPSRTVWCELWSYRRVVLPLLVARALMWLADGAVLVWADPSFSRRFNMAPDRIGAIMGGVLLVSGLLGPILGGPLADYCYKIGGQRRAVSALAVIAALCVPNALFGLDSNSLYATIELGVFLTLGYTLGTAAISLATIVVPGELRGLYISLTITVGAVFFIGAAPLAVSVLSGFLGGTSAISRSLTMVCGVSSFLGALVLVGSRKYFPTLAESVEFPITLNAGKANGSST